MLTSSTLSGRARHNAELRAESSSKPSEFRTAAERMAGMTPEQKAKIASDRAEQFVRKHGPVQTVADVDRVFRATYNVLDRRMAQEAYLSHVHGAQFITELKASVDGDRGRYSDALSRAVGAAATGAKPVTATSKPASDRRVEISPSGVRVISTKTGAVEFEHKAASSTAAKPAPAAEKPMSEKERVNAQLQARLKESREFFRQKTQTER
jgi:hypothetical protein